MATRTSAIDYAAGHVAGHPNAIYAAGDNRIDGSIVRLEEGQSVNETQVNSTSGGGASPAVPPLSGNGDLMRLAFAYRPTGEPDYICFLASSGSGRIEQFNLT